LGSKGKSKEKGTSEQQTEKGAHGRKKIKKKSPVVKGRSEFRETERAPGKGED